MKEIWKSIGNSGLYEVSNLGRVKSYQKRRGWRPGTVMKPQPLKDGYLQLRLHLEDSVKWVRVHQLVLRAFVGDRPDLVCNHKNGKKSDNRLENLEWVTSSYNSLHAIRTGLHKVLRHENHPMSKLTKASVIEIKGRLKCGESQQSISGDYGVSRGTIRDIKIGKTWRDVA